MKILSCGAGMQSTALALMSCENKVKGTVFKKVPIYDAVIFCDLGFEPYWVKNQVEFIQKACSNVGIPFYKNYFFRHLKENCKNDYEKVVAFDKMLEERQPDTAIKSKIFVSRSRKRVDELLPEECNDAEYFDYDGKDVWNGF